MAEETLRYRIEIDEASLQGELARSRGAITNVLQQAFQTGQYTLNSLETDLAVTRQVLGTPGIPLIASPAFELGRFAVPGQNPGLFRATLGAFGALPTPPNVLTQDFQEAAQRELESRLTETTVAIGREAIPIATGLTAVMGAMSLGARPTRALLATGASFLGGQAIGDFALRDVQLRSAAEEVLALTRSPHPMAPFTGGQRQELARGLAMDLASDVRFGVQDLTTILAMGMTTDQFFDVRNVEDFRSRFRAMLDQVRSITRVFQQTTEEAMQTLGELNRVGLASPEVMRGRIADIMALSRAGGIAPQQALAIGMGGAQMALGMGVPMGQGFDVMMQNALMAQTAAFAGAMDVNAFRQLGGVPGVAGLLTQAGFQMSQQPLLKPLLPAFANDTMTDVDVARVRRFVGGNLSLQEVQEMAMNRMADPAMQVRFAANVDLLQNQLATGGLAFPVMFRMAQIRAEMFGVPAEAMFGAMMQQMGLDPTQRQAMLAFASHQSRFEQIAARQQELAGFQLEMERMREDARFSARLGAEIEQIRTGLSTFIGDPIREVGRFFGGALENIAVLPSRALDWLDISLGRAVFGDRPMPLWSSGTGRTGGDGLTMADIERQARFLGGISLGDVAGPANIPARADIAATRRTLKDMHIMSTREAQSNLRDGITSVMWKVDLGGLKIMDRLSDEEKDRFQELAVATFAQDLGDLRREKDPRRRNELREELRQRMTGWIRQQGAHLMEDDVAESKAFAEKMLGIEDKAEYDEQVRRGIEQAAQSVAVLQVRQYVGEEMPALLASAASNEGAQIGLLGIATDVAAGFQGRPNLAAYQALKALGERAVPLLVRGAPIRERLEISQMAIERGFLRPGDLMLDTKELATIREQALTAGQAQFVDDLAKAARDAQGHELTADTVFRAIGIGLGREVPSNTPSPAAQLDPYKWDLTSQTLDKLSGAVNNLTAASSELLAGARDFNRRAAGKQ